jgi:hypothetical protein
MTTKIFNIGIVTTSLTLDNYPKGLVLKRELTIAECKYILKKILDINICTREDAIDEEEYTEYNLEYQKVVNKWLRGECSSKNIDYFRIIWDDRKIDIIDLIPILTYLKKRKIID